MIQYNALLSVHNQRYQRIFTLWTTSTTSNQLSTHSCLFESFPIEESSLTKVEENADNETVVTFDEMDNMKQNIHSLHQNYS